VEEAADLRSDDPLDFFDLRPYTGARRGGNRDGAGQAMVIGRGAIEDRLPACVMEFGFHGRPWAASSARSSRSLRGRRAWSAALSPSRPRAARACRRDPVADALPKTVCAVEDLHDAGGVLISVMAHPTTAGVLASFASLGDVLVAEPGALLSFTGPRVVQQTTREKLPDDFGLAESNYRYGHVDAIVPRPELRPTLGRLLRLFANGR
jgi:acetyl-CoA carboxylase carboxyl transferase subunit beta